MSMNPKKSVSAEPTPSDLSWRPPGGYAFATHWARENREALQAYAHDIETEGTAAQQLARYLNSTPGADRL